MIRYALPALLLVSALPAYAQAPASDVPLIERAKIFGNPSKTGAKLSPDGKWLSWIAPRDGVLNVWVAPASDLAKAKPLTDEKKRPIRNSFWSPDSRVVLFIQDKGGDENFLLYGVNVSSGKQTNYTPFEKTRAEVVHISSKVKDRILVAVNNRDPKWHDVYSLELASCKLTLVQQNDGYGGFLADDQLKLRLAEKPRADGGTTYFRITDGKIESTPLTEVGLDDSQTTNPLAFTTDGRTLYWTDARNRNTAALLAQDVASGKTTVVAEDARADIGAALADKRSGRIQAYSVNYLTQEYVALTNDLKADLAFLKQNTKGQFNVTSRTEADDKWLVAVDPVTAPASTWLYDRKAKKLTQLFVSRPELEGAPLAAMHPLELKARDGLTLVSYLTLPKAADPSGSGKPAKPVPLVLFVHGGPWARDTYGYHSYHQWLANRGYAVLSVNYRGSTGFGKNFISAGDLQWGRKMHDDLIDAVQWAVSSGITTPDKVAIMGGSYGGYATLAGVTFTPTTFACGVDIVGPSNLFTLLQTIPPYWEAGKQQFYKRMGDPNTEAGRELLKERSPLNYAANIQRPLLIGQGANDPRVNVRESEQIVQAMAAKNIPVTYVEFPDEGHGFARPVNNIAFAAVTENFLAKCLNGRAEPIGGALKASTAQVKHGAEFAPGLAEALQ
ncbi:prolyl oligopeptidase family serine peptidase [Duganella sp. FT80W]|uniref:Prolyl oligopeptidase family serine peptidase n=1 Tax=Duganella guangzhouensis TaxID=2666084 RepID=A0A6I2L823_9BURK|nr:S9 family peptidase [Duganella guangzhouensis]MRW93910.1 prolyl oligopeptidase family serine peptidase [Duganella guangzhouensis]